MLDHFLSTCAISHLLNVQANILIERNPVRNDLFFAPRLGFTLLINLAIIIIF